MVYLKWFLFCFLSLAMDVVGRVLAPLLVFFASDDGWLPRWLWWFQTPDNSLDGDRGHIERWTDATDDWTTYCRRLAWLWRNCAYGFNIEVLGFKLKDGDVKQTLGDPNVGDNSGVSGTCRWRVYRNGELVAFQWYYVKHYKLCGHWKCVRVGAGWKIWGQPSGKVFGQHWIYFNPFKGSGREDA